MTPWVELGRAEIPGGGELRLIRRGEEFSIQLGRIELMNSRRSASEVALAEFACRKILSRPSPRLLIGGLGMGFTLRAALAELRPDAEILVAELLSAILDWARGPLAPIFGECLADPRVTLRQSDVAKEISAGPSAYDAILLDVDNGPQGLTIPANDALYGMEGLAEAHKALRPGGILAIWSASSDEKFLKRLRQSGFLVEEIRVRAHGTGGPRHLIWIAVREDRPDKAPPAPRRFKPPR